MRGHGAGDESQAAILAYHRISDEERSPLFVADPVIGEDRRL